MYLAHAVDGAHEQLVEMAADEEEARLVEDQLDDTPDLLDEGRRQEEPHAHVLDALRPNVEALFDELLEGRLGTRRKCAQLGRDFASESSAKLAVELLRHLLADATVCRRESLC